MGKTMQLAEKKQKKKNETENIPVLSGRLVEYSFSVEFQKILYKIENKGSFSVSPHFFTTIFYTKQSFPVTSFNSSLSNF